VNQVIESYNHLSTNSLVEEGSSIIYVGSWESTGQHAAAQHEILGLVAESRR